MPAAASTARSNETSAADIFGILTRRVRVIVIVAGISMLIAIAFATRTRTYSATGAIRVQPGNANEYHTNTATRDTALPEDKIASAMAIVQSNGLHMQVAKELDLVHDKALWGSEKPKSYSLDDPRTRQRLKELMSSALRVYHSPKDEIITITCTTRSPVLSAEIVNTLVNDYVSYLFDMRLRSTQRVSKWLISQLEDLRRQVSDDQRALVVLQGKLGVIGLDPHDTAFLAAQSLSSFTTAASSATLDRIIAESKYRLLRESDPNLIEGEVNLLTQTAGGGSGSLLQTLRSTRAAAAASYANLSARFGPNYPDVQQAKAQLDELERQVRVEQARITNQARLAYEAADTNEKQAKAQVQQEKNEVFQSHGSMVEYSSLVNDYNAHRTLYDTLVQRLREAEITSGLEAGEVDVVDNADVPAVPVPPGPLFILTAGVLLGLVAGMLAALIVEVFDTHITTPEQAEKAANLPVLSVAPHVGRHGDESFTPIALRDLSPGYANAMEVLRSTVIQAQPDAGACVVMVSSAVAYEGRTVTAANLAAVLAQYDRNVLLVDCDFYGQGFSGAAGVKPEQTLGGLTDVLTKRRTLEQVLLQSADVAQLRLLPRGIAPMPAASLLGADAMRELLATCRTSFKFIVLDAPPFLGAAEALNLGMFADVILLVMRSGTSKRSYTRRMVELVSSLHLPAVGILLNDSRILQREQSRSAFRNFFAPRRRVRDQQV